MYLLCSEKLKAISHILSHLSLKIPANSVKGYLSAVRHVLWEPISLPLCLFCLKTGSVLAHVPTRTST